MKTDSQAGDPLDRLWNEVINLSPDASWLTQFTKRKSAAKHPIQGILPAMKRVNAAGMPAEDLSRVGRAERYTSCYNVLYALEDPGLLLDKLSGLQPLLAKHHPNAKSKPSREAEFFAVLWEHINPGDDGEFLEETANEAATKEPFGDSGPAYKHLLAAGIATADLARIMTWHRYEACDETLRIVSECCKSTDELAGLNTMLLSADPSGKEGRPGSWPFVTTPQNAAPSNPNTSVVSKDVVPKEKFTLKSVDHFEFTPDSRYIVASGSSAIRIFSTTNGNEVATAAKAKNPLAFTIAPDSKQAVATLDNAITIFDLATGAEVVRKRAQHPSRISWSPAGILVESMDAERLLDPKTLAPKPTPNAQSVLEEVASFHFSPDKELLATVSELNSTMLIRSWPKLNRFAEWPVIGVREADSWQWSPDGKFILAGNETKTLYEAKTGKPVWKLEGTQFGPVAYSPDGKWVVTGAHTGGRVAIWNVAKESKVREFSIKAGWCFGLHISNDGKLLGAATQRQCVFWDFPELVS